VAAAGHRSHARAAAGLLAVSGPLDVALEVNNASRNASYVEAILADFRRSWSV
jgi:hypothetical protein